MKRIAPLLLALLTAFAAQAYDFRKVQISSLSLSDVFPICHAPEVELLDEQVRLTVLGAYTEVSVRYQLHNTSSHDLSDIPCGFAVNYCGSGPVRLARINYWNTEWAEMRETGWSDAYIKDVSFALDGAPLSWRCPPDSLLQPARPLTNLPFSADVADSIYSSGLDADDVQFDLLLEAVGGSEGDYMERFFILENGLSRRQYLTHISLRSGQTAVFTVRYLICNRRTVTYSYNNSFYPTIDNGCFGYSFSQDAGWGNGHAKHLSMTIDMSAINMEHSVWYGDPDDPNTSKSSVTTISYDDFDLAASHPVDCRFSTRINLAWSDFMSRRIDPSMYHLIFSCEDAKYPPANLSDGNVKTAAVLHPNGKGRSYINIRFKEPMPVTGVMLLGGYGKDSAAWYNNSRVEKIRMVVIDSVGQPDKSFAWDIDYFPITKEPKGFSPDLLTRSAIKIPLNKDYYAPSLPLDADDKLISEIRLQVMGTAPGIKYDDLCISEIVVLGR